MAPSVALIKAPNPWHIEAHSRLRVLQVAVCNTGFLVKVFSHLHQQKLTCPVVYADVPHWKCCLDLPEETDFYDAVGQQTMALLRWQWQNGDYRLMLDRLMQELNPMSDDATSIPQWSDEDLVF